MGEENKELKDTLQGVNLSSSMEAAKALLASWHDGTFREIVDDWKWIFTYSARYKGAILFYIILGIVSTTMGLVGSIASKYLIDIITGYKTDKFALLLAVMIGSTIFSLVVGSVLSRITLKLGININNAIQADIFDKIIDSDWLAMNKYNNGDVLNRFNADVSTVSGNAISWLPSIIIAVYH
ncbi:MAG: ABC transporter transmembrane domain-containing protein, partial [Ruminococcus sp.]|nr:ABC transporter transmembrane domain-containing protein [Ruminococcus sp.]